MRLDNRYLKEKVAELEAWRDKAETWFQLFAEQQRDNVHAERQLRDAFGSFTQSVVDGVANQLTQGFRATLGHMLEHVIQPEAPALVAASTRPDLSIESLAEALDRIIASGDG